MRAVVVEQTDHSFSCSLFAAPAAPARGGRDVLQYTLLAWPAGWSAIRLGRFRDLG